MKKTGLMIKLTMLILTITAFNQLRANNISVSNVELKNVNTVAHTAEVEFDISWENSWRTNTGPSNWDAAWVFIKFKNGSGTWNHVTLNTSGHTAPAGSIITTPSDAKGVFIYRSANGIGTVSYTDVRLVWNYNTDGVDICNNLDISVFAIEMVYVPQGSFYVGDGTNTDIQGHFERGTSGAALQITSEDALTLGGGGAGSLGNNNASDMGIADDFNDATTRTLPAGFPKGYNGFYCMKYPITQEQYVAFLNTLTRAQQDTRTAVSLGAGTTSVTNRYVMSMSLSLSHRNGIRCDASIHTSNPITFYCDFNGNGTGNETADGQNIACNFLNWADLSAYLDWAALRPFTELEYEKACRGNQAPVADEYAWGSTSITQVTGISNSGNSNETASNSAANCVYNYHPGVQGPMRVGNFGQGVNTREGVGAGYYGIMELSGSLEERTVTVGNATGRAFTGTHGNGALNATGDADASNWPGPNAMGAGARGGDWANSTVYMRVSSRMVATYDRSSRQVIYGGRGVRSFPGL